MTVNNHKSIFGPADLAMITTCFLWGVNTVVTKNALGDNPESFHAFVFNGLRIPLASLLLFITVKLSGGSLRIKHEHIPLFLMVALFGMFLFMVSFIVGIKMTTASNTGIISATIPLFIILISFITNIEQPTKITLTGVVIGFCGMVALSMKQGTISCNFGDILILASSLFWAIYTVFGKRILTVYTPMVTIAWVYLITSLFQLPLLIYELPHQHICTISNGNWLNFAISTVGSLYIANTLYYYSIEKIGPARTGVYTNLTPVFTLLLAVIIRGETITPLQILGLTIILIGIAISKIK